MKFPEKYRITYGQFNSPPGGPGAFMIPHKKELARFFCIASDAHGWEHVSVSLKYRKKTKPPRVPTWDEMCRIKDLFWEKNKAVVQFHPAEKDYVNFHKFTLHLWRPLEQELPTPPIILV